MRVDASTLIGSGHVARCLTLAKALQGLGAQVSFACRRLAGDLSAQIAAQGWPVYRLAVEAPDDRAQARNAANIEALLPWQPDIAALAGQLPPGTCFDWIVVDHYGLDRQWEVAARPWAAQIMAIDDLANRAHEVDLLLDQNFNASTQRYAPWLEGRCRTLLGPEYALLREEFERDARPVRQVVERVVVNFGGMDAAGQTLKALQALMGCAGQQVTQVTFVAGLSNPHWAELQALVEQRPQWQLLAYSADFGQLMAAADLFIGAAGGTTWERAALGLPTLCMAVAANQQDNAQALAAAGVHRYLGPCAQVSVAALAEAIGELLANVEARQRYARLSRQLVDGRGARRVAAALGGVPGS
jgi:UDP-2,4-diacetamido-2,4,6-trideoxy-beta-L-altropyranose hydrolase